MNRDRTAGSADRSRQRDVLGADGDAVLGVPAHLDAPLVGERPHPLVGDHLAGGMGVEEHRLADRMGAHEAPVERGLAAGTGKLGSDSCAGGCFGDIVRADDL